MNDLGTAAKALHDIGQSLSLKDGTLDLGDEWKLEPRVCLMRGNSIIVDIGNDWEHSYWRGLSSAEMEDLQARIAAKAKR